MSTPGGHGGYGQDPNQQYDPVTGQPVPPGGQTGAYPGPDTSAYHGLGQYPQTSAYPSNFPTGGFAPQQPPPPRKRTGLIVGVIAAVLVVAVGATLTIVLLNKNDDPQAGGGTPGSSTSAPPPTSATRATTTTAPASVKPAYPGWQTVTAPDGRVQYDVPPDWKVETGDEASVTVTGSGAYLEGVSTYKLGACPGQAKSFRAKVGVATPSTATPGVMAKQVAQQWADALAKAYKGKSATPTTTEERVNGGKTVAYLAVVRVTTKKDDCNPPRMLVAVVSFQSHGSTESLVVFGDQDVPDAISTEDVAKVLNTVRPPQ